MTDTTHKLLVGIAARYAASEKGLDCGPCVLVEPRIPEGAQPDVLAFDRMARSHVIEVKRTRSDFLADAKKQGCAVGEFHWMFAPVGTFIDDELPPHMGSLKMDEHGDVFEERPAERIQTCEGTLLIERKVLVDFCRRPHAHAEAKEQERGRKWDDCMALLPATYRDIKRAVGASRGAAFTKAVQKGNVPGARYTTNPPALPVYERDDRADHPGTA